MRRLAVFPAVVAGSLVPAQLSARGPAFDCAKASGTVPEMICEDARLAALDRKLDGVYQAALAKVRDDMSKLLRAEQRGWIKGRDDCWKARGDVDPDSLSPEREAAAIRACVEREYQLRISELQATWQLVPHKGPVLYACAENPADEVAATFYETDPHTVRLERGDRTAIAWLVPTDGEVVYEGRNVTLVVREDGVTVVWLEEKLRCRKAAR